MDPKDTFQRKTPYKKNIKENRTKAFIQKLLWNKIIQKFINYINLFSKNFRYQKFLRFTIRDHY